MSLTPDPMDVVKLRTELEKLGPGPYLMTCGDSHIPVNETDETRAAEHMLNQEGPRLHFTIYNSDTGEVEAIMGTNCGLAGIASKSDWSITRAVRCDYYDTLVPREAAVPFLDKFISYECLEAWANEERTHFGVIWYLPGEGARLYVFNGDDYQEDDIKALFHHSPEWLWQWATSRRPVEPVPCLILPADTVVMSLSQIVTHQGFFLYPVGRPRESSWTVKVFHGK
jgi:hypothetical protein